MPSYFISAHGNLRRDGNRETQPKFIVPKATTIYFFTQPGTTMSSSGSDMMMDVLINPTFNFADELALRKEAVEVFREGDLCLNYTAHTNGGRFRDPTGVYLVGNAASRTAQFPIPEGTSKTLKDLVCGIGGGSLGNHFYWCACRSHDVDHRPASQHLFLGFGGRKGPMSGGDTMIKIPGQQEPVFMGLTDVRSGRKEDLFDSMGSELSSAKYSLKVKQLLQHIKKTGGLF